MQPSPKEDPTQAPAPRQQAQSTPASTQASTPWIRPRRRPRDRPAARLCPGTPGSDLGAGPAAANGDKMPRLVFACFFQCLGTNRDKVSTELLPPRTDLPIAGKDRLPLLLSDDDFPASVSRRTRWDSSSPVSKYAENAGCSGCQRQAQRVARKFFCLCWNTVCTLRGWPALDEKDGSVPP